MLGENKDDMIFLRIQHNEKYNNVCGGSGGGGGELLLTANITL